VTDHLDDLLILIYPLVGLRLWWQHHRQLLRLTLMMQCLGIGAMFFAVMIGFDLFGRSPIGATIEECCKLFAEMFILLGFLAVAYALPALPAKPAADLAPASA
jgi:hypothetical protein